MNKTKYVITIARQFGSMGRPIAMKLSELLGIEFYDRDIVDQAAEKLNLPVSIIDENEESAKEIYNNYFRMQFPLGRQKSTDVQDKIFEAQKNIIGFLAEKESCIIVGRCADIILRNNYIPHISLFISAPFEVRLHYMMNVREMDQKTAVKFLKKMDRQHKKYYEFYTSEKWGTPENYDLCINSANYGIKETIEIIERLIINRKKA